MAPTFRAWASRIRSRLTAGTARPDGLGRYRERVRQAAAAGQHRGVSGGLWESMGPLLMDYLVEQGLSRDHRVLDIGCGALRIGLHLVDYLDPGNYYGVDMSPEMLAAGYDIELTAAGLTERLPRNQLVANDRFDFRLLPGAPSFDVALAQSLFTHLPIGHLRLCLGRLAPCMRPQGVLHATFFLVPDARAWIEPALHEPGGITTHPIGDPYHHTWEDLVQAASDLPWSVEDPVDISHPRAQSMVRFTRSGDGRQTLA